MYNMYTVQSVVECDLAFSFSHFRRCPDLLTFHLHFPVQLGTDRKVDLLYRSNKNTHREVKIWHFMLHANCKSYKM